MFINALMSLNFKYLVKWVLFCAVWTLVSSKC